jgi:hypothetical protein
MNNVTQRFCGRIFITLLTGNKSRLIREQSIARTPICRHALKLYPTDGSEILPFTPVPGNGGMGNAGFSLARGITTAPCHAKDTIPSL